MKSFLIPLTEPLACVWCLMVAGLIWACIRRRWFTAGCLGLPTLLLFLCGGPGLTEMLVAKAEKPFADQTAGSQHRASLLDVDAVVVLGGGYYYSEHDAYGFSLATAGSRLLAGLELARIARPKALVLGGSVPVSARPQFVTTSCVQDWVQGLVPASMIITNLGLCADTHDEAVRFSQLQRQFQWKKVALVTSALHMARSQAVFAKQGVSVFPVACDFQVYGAGYRFGRFSPFPREQRLLILGLYTHERIGWLVYRWRGWV